MALALASGVPAQAAAPNPPAALNLPKPAAPAAAPKTTGCLIEPERWADVGSPVVGIVEQVMVDRGDNVRSGQTLVRLRAGVEQAAQSVADTRARADAEVRAAAVALDLAAQKHKRAESLQARQFISPQALEQAQSELELAQHRLQQAQVQHRIFGEESRLAQAQLGQRTVRSPFDGIVSERYVSAGERVDDRPLLRVAVVDPLRVELMVPATLWGRLRTGDSVSVQPELPGAAAATARVVQIDRVLDPASNTFRVRLNLPNAGHQLPAGLRCKVDLDGLAAAATSRPAAPAAPANASPPAPTAARTAAPGNVAAPAPAAARPAPPTTSPEAAPGGTPLRGSVAQR